MERFGPTFGRIGPRVAGAVRADLRSDRADRAEISAGTRLRAALYGIGETGEAEDIAVARRFVEHPHTRVRRASLYALAHLDMEANVEVFVEALQGSRLGVARDAANWLARFPHLIEPHSRTLQSLRDDPDRAEFAATVLEAADTYAQRWVRNE